MKWIAPSVTDSDSATLEKKLWDAADQFRANSGLKPQEYSGPILGLIFLRFAEVRFIAQRAVLAGQPSPLAPLPAGEGKTDSGAEKGTGAETGIIGSIKTLKDLDYLDSEAGKELGVALKMQAISKPNNLDDFETLANVINSLPESFTEDELKPIRTAYSEFAEQYANECDIQSPNALRNEASRIGEIGELFDVVTDAAQDALNDYARDIESKEDSYWGDEEYGGMDTSDDCSDETLDSMFRTLTN